MIAISHVKPLVALYRIECDECHKSRDIVIDLRQADAVGGVESMLASHEPYERAALSREGCPHAVPEPVEEPEAAPTEPENPPA